MAFHSETGGQMELANTVIEQYLWSYVLSQQDDWASKLSKAAFTANNHASQTPTVSPFVANYGYHPWFNFNLVQDIPMSTTIDAPAMAKAMRELQDDLQTNMRNAQD